jgi:competence protein ComGF
MILGLSIQTFTVIHVIISLLAIASGILVLIGMLRSNRMRPPSSC